MRTGDEPHHLCDVVVLVETLVIPRDLDLDERKAAALPRDFPQDFDGEYGRNVCTDCLHIFQGRSYRTKCALCAPKQPLWTP